MKRLLCAIMLLGVFAVGVPAKAVVAQEPASPEAVDSTAKQPESEQKEVDENDGFKHSTSVRAIGRMLGLEPEKASTAFEWVNFGLLALGVGWLMIKALPKTFRNRSTAIQKHLVDARAATEQASARLSSVEARLSKLDEQIAAMRAQAEKDSAADEKRIKATVEEEKQKILAAAEQEISAATVHARRQIQQYAADLAIDQAAKKLVVSAETDRLLVQNFARRLVGDDKKEGQN